jgi:NADH-quinone oxidoreductase subunit F/NADP-reducing hydrogenase subunit HndC
MSASMAVNGEANVPNRLAVKVCAGTACVASGSLEVVKAFRQALASNRDLDASVEVSEDCLGSCHLSITGCHGFCAMGPLVKIPHLGVMYCQVKPKDAEKIVERTLRHGEVLPELLFTDPVSHSACRGEQDIPFFQKQKRSALKWCGEINPERIEEYIAVGGYKALERVLKEMEASQIIEEVKRSGLRGRGGAGFPTGLKWQFVRDAEGEPKYLVCNGDEGDPGAFMDRSLMEGDPHSVIEGMAIAARAVGACRGFIYVRAEYPLAVNRLKTALGQARDRGFLGDDILGTGFSFDLSIVEGAGAFVCGEETALLNSIEGRRGTPRPRPPYPALEGLWRRPTLINNVETYANVTRIFNEGAAAFSNLGTKRCTGTKTFALTGAVNNVGLVEVPMGVTLREIIFDIGGGIRNGRSFKAAQTGGPSGGCIPEEFLDTPIDYESLAELGSMMGSGGLVVMDDSTCMVKVAQFFLKFCVEESCGKCPPCRIGTKVMLNILDRICEGKGEPGDIERLERLGHFIKKSSLCGLGQTAPNPTLSTIRYFREEYEAHIHDKKCPAGECRALLTYSISTELCTGCHVCAKACPVGAISGELKHVHEIDQDICIHCGACLSACPTGAVQAR